jgi:hypothetical protein
MPRKTSYLPALLLLCGVAQAGVSVADGPRFIGRLPQGTVELVGVTYYPPTNDSAWWLPDGSAASIGPFLPPGRPSRPRVPANQKKLVFLVRFENLPADASRDPAGGIDSYTIREGDPHAIRERSGLSGSGTKRNPSRNLFPGSDLWEATDVYGAVDARGAPLASNARSPQHAATDRANSHPRNDKPVPYYDRMFCGVLRASAPTTDLRVGTSMGAWETVLSRKPDFTGESSFSRDGQKWTVTIEKANTPAAASPHSTRFIVTSLPTYGLWNKRLVAVASDGRQQASRIGRTVGGDSGEAAFALSLSSIKELRLQVRPYHWVEFYNISLQSGKKAEVKVFSPDAPK